MLWASGYPNTITIWFDTFNSVYQVFLEELPHFSPTQSQLVNAKLDTQMARAFPSRYNALVAPLQNNFSDKVL
jgi:hypothetical protein